jgi:enhancing lycopene biosynthesis protein 2
MSCFIARRQLLIMLRRTSGSLGRKVALILSGCGVKDGSECQESASLMIHLNRLNIEYDVFAPSAAQYHVYNHQADDVAKGEFRDMMAESARLARGPVKPVDELKHDGYSGLLMPGGFGVMKNLSDYGLKGKDGGVRDDVSSAIMSFHKAGKPIGASCIAPILLAATLRDAVTITLGEEQGETQDLARSFGTTVVKCAVDRAVVDDGTMVVTTPAYMYADAGPAQIYEGIGVMVEAVDRLMK